MAIEVVHWNPKRPLAPGLLGKLIPIRRSVNNFGDLLGPEIVKFLASRAVSKVQWEGARGRLLAVGSILSLARPGDVVWGAGINGKSLDRNYDFRDVHFRAVRGPLTRQFVVERGAHCPEIYGDPGLLVSHLWDPETLRWPEQDVTIVPNLNDLSSYDLSDPRVLRPTSSLRECLSRIKNSKLVVGSSLHGIIVAESFGVPARLVRSAVEPEFKYMDYYLGSGRTEFRSAATTIEAIALGGEPLPKWESRPLIDAFPIAMWNTSQQRAS